MSYLRDNENLLKAMAWQVEAALPPEVLAAKGSLGPAERRLCYWLGRNWLSGRGCVVDVGAYLGSASMSFAAGAAAAGRRGHDGRPLIHAFDQFTASSQYLVEAITRDVRPIEEGQSYVDIFQEQVADFADLIQAHQGDLLEQQWSGEPIEALFVGGITSAKLNSHVVRQFFPSLIPGRSIVVYKAYYHCWHPYIQVGMAFFDDEFELVDGLVPYQSRVWRLAKPLSGEKIARMGAYRIDPQERLALFDHLIGKSEEPSRAMLEVTRLWQLILDGDRDRARSELPRLKEKYKYNDRSDLWAKQAQQVEQNLAGGVGR